MLLLYEAIFYYAILKYNLYTFPNKRINANKINPVEIIEDRAAAITQAVHYARATDTVLVAGKGHEDYQEINGIKYPFSDILIAQQALQSWSSRAQQGAGPHKGTMS